MSAEQPGDGVIRLDPALESFLAQQGTNGQVWTAPVDTPLFPSEEGPKVKIYFDLHDWWIGYYQGVDHHYICILPTIVLRIRRRNRWVEVGSTEQGWKFS